MKKLTVLPLVLIMLIQSVCASFAFYDVDSNTKMGQAVLRLYENNIVDGMGNGYFHPQGILTRAQFVKMVNRVFGYTHAGEGSFSDVSADKWYYEDVCIASEAGYIKGMGDGRFAPEELVSREQACVILNNILKMDYSLYLGEPSDYVSPWAKDGVLAAISSGLVQLENGNVFRATAPMTRGEACEMLNKCFAEDTTPADKIDVDAVAKAELAVRLNRVITNMNEKVIPRLTNEKTVTVANMIVDNMRVYLLDSSHDYKKASNETFEIYKTIPKDEREKFKAIVQEENRMEDLLILYEFFYAVE